MTLLAAEPSSAIAADARSQAEALADAFDSSIAVWRHDETGGWQPVVEVPWPGRPSPDADLDVDAAQRAVAIGAVVVTGPDGATGRTSFIAPLSCRGPRVYAAVGSAAVEHQLTIQKLAAAAISGCRHTAENSSLQDENDTFAVQLSSDLEELSFLRAIVTRLGDTAAAAELTGMARETLPVLNETVRARCLAFLVSEDPERPYDARVAYRIGSTDPDDRRLVETVAAFGEQALDGPFVRNWDSEDALINNRVGPRLPGVRSLVLCPLASAGNRFGWLAAVNRRAPSDQGTESSWQLASDEFGSGEATLIETSASILAMHAANLEMLREKEQIIVNVVRSLVSAIEAKDPYTRGHSERVALYTRRISEEMGYFESEAEQIYLSGLLHDVGKIGVSDETLKKPGRLTEEEFAEIAKHPDEGWAILCDLKQLSYVLPGVLHHHERWDGKGYPDGLAGPAIPIEGRIMAVADAFDAMTSDRAYRTGMSNEKAESILREGAGSQWDPECVDAFFACMDDIRAIQTSYQQRDRRQRTPGDQVREG